MPMMRIVIAIRMIGGPGGRKPRMPTRLASITAVMKMTVKKIVLFLIPQK